MTITQITDHQKRAKDRLPGFMLGATNIEAFIDAISAESQVLESVFFQLLDERHLTVAVGTQLDGLGQILDLDRVVGQTDTSYRIALIARAGELAKGGEIETLITAMTNLTGLSPPDAIELYEAFPASIIMTWLTDVVDPRDSNMAVKFDGVDDFIGIPHNSDLSLSTEDYTVEMLITLPPVSEQTQAWTRIAGKGAYQIDGWEINYKGGTGYAPTQSHGMSFSLNQVGASTLINLPGQYLTDNTKHHIVFTRGGVNSDIYVDGVPVATTSGMSDAVAETSRTLYVSYNESFSNTKCTVHSFRIYKNRVLTPAEVAEHYNGIYNDETGRVLYLPLIEGSGIIANDHSGNGNNGTLINGPTWEVISNVDAELVSGINAVRAAGVQLHIIRSGQTGGFEFSKASEVVGGDGPIDINKGFGDEVLTDGGELARVI